MAVCNGREFKCLNATHYQKCVSIDRIGASPLLTLSDKVLTCLEGLTCDEKGDDNCGQIVKSESDNTAVKSSPELKKTRKRIRLIKGKRASNWRPRLTGNSDEQKKAVENYRDRLIKQRRKQEEFLDSIVAKQNQNKNQQNKNQQNKNQKNKNQHNKNQNNKNKNKTQGQKQQTGKYS